MQQDPDPLLTQRAALIFLLGALSGIGAAGLALWDGASPQGAALIGCGSFVGAVLFFNGTIA